MTYAWESFDVQSKVHKSFRRIHLRTQFKIYEFKNKYIVEYIQLTNNTSMITIFNLAQDVNHCRQ